MPGGQGGAGFGNGYGGAISCLNASSPIIRNCTFSGNAARGGMGGNGGNAGPPDTNNPVTKAAAAMAVTVSAMAEAARFMPSLDALRI